MKSERKKRENPEEKQIHFNRQAVGAAKSEKEGEREAGAGKKKQSV